MLYLQPRHTLTRCGMHFHTDGSIQWIPKKIVGIGEDFDSQVGDGKVRTTLYKVRWEGYEKKDTVTPGSPSHIYRDMLPW